MEFVLLYHDIVCPDLLSRVVFTASLYHFPGRHDRTEPLFLPCNYASSSNRVVGSAHPSPSHVFRVGHSDSDSESAQVMYVV